MGKNGSAHTESVTQQKRSQCEKLPMPLEMTKPEREKSREMNHQMENQMENLLIRIGQQRK